MSIRALMQPLYLFKDRRALKNIKNSLAQQAPLLLLLDYDGTLVPFKKKPAMALLPVKVQKILQDLGKRSNFFIAIVSGRSLKDLKEKVGLKNIFYIANHGFQIALNQKRWRHPIAQSFLPLLRKIYKELKKSLQHLPGVMVENKIFTLSVHYRNMPSGLFRNLKNLVYKTVGTLSQSCKITKGKKVLEIRPDVEWDKGLAVIKLLEFIHFIKNPLILYIGDDWTDEDAFKRLQNTQAITIRVGKKNKSHAKYYLKNPAEVKRLLQSLS